MRELSEIATYLFDCLHVNDTKNLALVESQIFNGPPTSYISTSVFNGVPKRKTSKNLKFWDYVKKLKLKKPNLHTLKDSLKGLQLTMLTLEWGYPNVRCTTYPNVNLQEIMPKLNYLKLREIGPADFSLLFFKQLTLPLNLKYLDVSELHLPDNELDFYPVIIAAKGRKSIFCKCCSKLTKEVWEKNWSEIEHIDIIIF
jgi:hypothetical protein